MAGALPGEEITISLPSGQSIVGGTDGSGYIQFLGIPYASADRWKSPIPFIPQNGSIITAKELKPGHACPQICREPLFCPASISEESCLALNIWTPFRKIDDLKAGKLPVLVYIHGGSFEIGTGSLNDLGALSRNLNAVVVSFNYRVSIFGFLKLPGNEPQSINFGIQDQRTALLWTKSTIGLFGSDVSKLTILGQSAGALSALIHRRHPQTQSLAQNLILMSPPAVALSTLEDSTRLAHSLNSLLCPVNAGTESCLRNQSTRALLNAMEDQKALNNALSFDRTLLPVVDNIDIFDNPFETLKNTDIMSGTNVIIGSVANETYLFVDGQHPDSLTTPLFDVMLMSAYPKNYESIKEVYPDTEGFIGDQKSRLVRITTDSLFFCPLHQASDLVSTTANVFSYHFAAHWLGGNDEAVGDLCSGSACHTTDLVYLFKDPAQVTLMTVARDFRSYFANFLRHSTPGTGSENSLVDWRRNGEMKFSVAGQSFQKSPEQSKECQFWDNAGYQYANDTSPNVPVDPALDLILLVIIFGLFFGLITCQIVLLCMGMYRNQRLKRIHKVIAEHELELKKMMMTDAESLPSNDEKIVIDQMFLEPPEPLSLVCQELDYMIKDKFILKQVSFECLPGSITAIMGPSGSGKTTLLSLLARRTQSRFSSSIKLGQIPINRVPSKTFRNKVGFVMQHDPPFWGLTAREVLTYYAALEAPLKTSNADISKRVIDLLELMDLVECSNVLISQPGRGGISGGQLRRLAIATVLLRSPGILILDEPTSGLDSKNTLEVIKVLSRLAQRGHTIICSIHQPRYEVYSLFNQVLVLVRGSVICQGGPSDAIRHFQRVAKEQKLDLKSDSSNPADLILDVASELDSQTKAAPKAWSFESFKLNASLINLSSLDVSSIFNPVLKIQKSETTLVNSSMPVLGSSNSKFSLAAPSTSPIMIQVDGSKSTTTFLSSIKETDELETHDFSIEEPVIPGNSFFLKVMIVNNRWWSVRPFTRKVLMLIISAFIPSIMGLIQRRTGHDFISFGLQMKGLLLGLPAIKNISISYDYYADRDIYNFDSINGSVGFLCFFIHRFLFETATSSLEAILTLGSAYFILDCNSSLNRFITILLLFVVYYNTVVSLYTCLFSTRLGRPEARSCSFLIQAFLAISCGLWIQSDDTPFYRSISWIQYANPMYWVLSSLVRLNVAGAGECITMNAQKICLATTGDLFLSQIRAHNSISTLESLGALVTIWFSIRVIQVLLLASDAYNFRLFRR